MPKFQASYAKELLEIAEQDIESAKVLAESWKKGRIENIFFLVQQAVEKSLKAYLCHRFQEFPMVHDIGILLGKMDLLPPHGYSLVSFSQFAGVGTHLLISGQSTSCERVGDLWASWHA